MAQFKSLRRFLTENNISEELCQRVTRFLQYSFEQKRSGKPWAAGARGECKSNALALPDEGTIAASMVINTRPHYTTLNIARILTMVKLLGQTLLQHLQCVKNGIIWYSDIVSLCETWTGVCRLQIRTLRCWRCSQSLCSVTWPDVDGFKPIPCPGAFLTSLIF